MSDSSIPQKPPFEETRDYVLETLMYGIDLKHHTQHLLDATGERGRVIPVSPMDDDIIKWYFDRLQKYIITHEKKLTELRQRYDRGEL